MTENKFIKNNVNKIQELILQEESRQSSTLSLIASENIASNQVRKALSSSLTNKYAEGYPEARYYAGCQVADEIEKMAISSLKNLFGCEWANVQPHSGSQANQAVFLAVLKPGDTILSLSLEAGGHLTHGAKVSSSGILYNAVHYTLDKNGLIDLNQVEELAKKHKPKLIISGASSYPRNWNWKEFKKIAKDFGAYLLADIAHIAGLVAANEHDSPIGFADLITSTTHKTLRGPRGGVIFGNDLELGKKVDRALFPGIQGGPQMNNIAAKAISFEEAAQEDFKLYIKKVKKNAFDFAELIKEAGGDLVTGGTDNHLMILDCRSFGLNGNDAQDILSAANVLISKSAMLDDISWKNPSGIRLGTPYMVTLGVDNIDEFGSLFVDALKNKRSDKLKNWVERVVPDLYSRFVF